MHKVYRSRIGLLVLFIPTILFVIITTTLIYKKELLPLLVFMLINFFTVYFVTGFKYIIDCDFLIIKMSFFTLYRIDINQIKRIENTGSLLSAPAAAITGRILIAYVKGSEVVISPRHLISFCEDLKAINPNIDALILQA